MKWQRCWNSGRHCWAGDAQYFAGGGGTGTHIDAQWELKKKKKDKGLRVNMDKTKILYWYVNPLRVRILVVSGRVESVVKGLAETQLCALRMASRYIQVVVD